MSTPSQPIKVGDIVYSLDDCQAGYGEEAIVEAIHETPRSAPTFAPSCLYTLRTKSGAQLTDMLRSEFSRKPLPSFSQVFQIQVDPTMVAGVWPQYVRAFPLSPYEGLPPS